MVLIDCPQYTNKFAKPKKNKIGIKVQSLLSISEIVTRCMRKGIFKKIQQKAIFSLKIILSDARTYFFLIFDLNSNYLKFQK